MRLFELSVLVLSIGLQASGTGRRPVGVIGTPLHAGSALSDALPGVVSNHFLREHRYCRPGRGPGAGILRPPSHFTPLPCRAFSHPL